MLRKSLNLNIFIFATIFVIAVSGGSEIFEKISCRPNQFQCPDGACIPEAYHCNGNLDCKDGDDERNCDIIKCEDKQKFFKCRDGVSCISRLLICDNEGDCPDNSDESDELCPDVTDRVVENKIECNKTTEFECLPRVCIPIEDRCDGVKHCRNGKDEEDCKSIKVHCSGFLCDDGICLMSHESHCDGEEDCTDGSDERDCSPACELRDNKFLCSDDIQCLDLSKVCDGTKDCTDGSDEGGKCKTKDSKDPCEDLECKIKCASLPDGPKCICEKGYAYNKSTKKCEDINECEEFGICSHTCVNTEGSYNCECANGYRLNKDKKSCDSFHPDDIHLVFTTKKYIKRIQLSTGFENLVAQTRRPIGISFDGDSYYWTEVSSGKEAIVKMEQNSTEKEILFSNGLELPEDIAVDWLTKNIYFTDSSLNHIAVCTNDGYYCTKLIQAPQMEKVRAIALHPLESLIFWSDWGKEAHIGVAYMDGSEFRVLVSNVLWPNGLTLDWFNGRIYWIDALDSSIESTTIEGKDRRTILSDVFKHPFSIAVHGNRLYWSDKGSRTIEYCDKFTGKHHDVLSHNPDVFDIHIYDKTAMPPKRHACLNNQCSHLCLLSKGETYTCACPVNMVLKANKRDCVISSQSYNLIFGIENYLVSTPHNVFGRHAEQGAIPMRNIDADKIAYNSAKGSIFVADNDRKIIIEYDLLNKMSTDLVSKDISHVTSMSYDYHSNNLYWCDKIKNTIEVFSLNTKKRALIQHYSGDNKVIGIILIPSAGEMFVALQSKNHTHIDRQSMQGDMIDDSHHHVIEDDLSRSGYFSLAVDEQLQKLYWSDSSRRIIEFSNFDGTERKVLAFTTPRTPYTIALISDEIIWTSEKSKSLQSRQKDAQGPVKKFQIEMPDSASSKSSISITSGSPLTASANPCLRDNGGCSDICISNGPRDRICKCATGNTFVDKSSQFCVGQTICDFKCGSGECIKASQVCDGTPNCADKSDENCKSITCRMDQFKCNDGSCIDGHLKCDKNFNCPDKSDEENCEFKCLDDQLKCKTVNECVDNYHICDRHKDCSDGSDETEEMCKIPCPIDSFKCASGQCIPKPFECDKKIDCADASDEHEKCITNCKPPLKSCVNEFFCIDEKLFCDGHKDCPDGTDEINCEKVNSTCDPLNEFQCPSNKEICLPIKKVCDDRKDCPKGEDEKDCFNCPYNMFECKNGRCIKESQKCDGFNNCGDFSDESDCNKSKIIPQVPCEPNTFRCNDGTCLEYSQVCNDQEDCDSDEGPTCKSACIDSKCEICKETPKGAVCFCKQGYQLKSKGDHDCIDIDECLQNPCSQICINLPGSYKCKCNEGYMLALDRTSCKAIGGTSKLFYNLYNEIRVHGPASGGIIVNGSFPISDFAVDVRKEKLIFTYNGQDDLFEFNITTKNLKVMENVTQPRRIFYDWITENIYVISRENHVSAIHICSMEQKTCVLSQSFPHIQLIKDIGDIDPINRWLFLVRTTLTWIFSKPTSEIIKMRLDGSEMVTILSDLDVAALAIDPKTQLIYYISASLQSLHSIDYDGVKRRTYAYQSKLLQKPVDISIFENHAYIIDQKNSKIVRCMLYDEYECAAYPGLDTGSSTRAMMMHPVKQIDMLNACESHRCENICVVSDTGRKCLCGDEKVKAKVCEENVIVASAAVTTENSSSSHAWIWTLFIVVALTSLMVATVYYFHQRRPLTPHFNINVLFRKREGASEFTNASFEKSPQQPSAPFMKRFPNVLGMFPKGFEFINRDHNANHFSKSNEMQIQPDDEFMEDVEYRTHDQTERLIN